MEGILLGVVFSLVLLLRAFAFPPDAVLGRAPDGKWHDPTYRPEAEPCPGSGLPLLGACCSSPTCNLFRDRVEALVAAAPRR